VHPLAAVGLGLEELGGGARDPAPDGAGQLVPALQVAVGLAIGDADRLLAVPADEEESGFPDLCARSSSYQAKPRGSGKVPRSRPSSAQSR